MSVTSWAALWLLYGLLYVLTSYTILLAFDHPRPHRQQPAYQIFPSSHFHAFHTPFQVLRVETEQKNSPTLAFLIQTVRKQTYQLWSTLPYAVAPPPVLVCERQGPFGWASNDDGNLLVVADATQICLLRQADLSRSTLGTWKVKQTWSWDEAVGLNPPEDRTVPTVSLTPDGTSVLILTARGLVALFRLDADTYYWQPLTMDHVKIDFQLYPRSLLAEHNLLVTAVPDFRQTDGVVDLYHVSYGDKDFSSVELLQTLSPPLRGSYFGGHVATAQLQGVPLVLVSAPFANKGTGALYIYSRSSEDHMFQVGQTIEGTEPVEQLGRTFALSASAQFLVVSTVHTLCLFEFHPPTRIFRPTKLFPNTPANILSLHVDNVGNVFYSTATHVRAPAQVQILETRDK